MLVRYCWTATKVDHHPSPHVVLLLLTPCACPYAGYVGYNHITSVFLLIPPKFLSFTSARHTKTEKHGGLDFAHTHIHVHTRLCARWREFAIQFPLLNGTFSLPAGSYPWLSGVSAYSAFIIKKMRPETSPASEAIWISEWKKKKKRREGALIFNISQG